jgi:hypothetical protein
LNEILVSLWIVGISLAAKEIFSSNKNKPLLSEKETISLFEILQKPVNSCYEKR